MGVILAKARIHVPPYWIPAGVYPVLRYGAGMTDERKLLFSGNDNSEVDSWK